MSLIGLKVTAMKNERTVHGTNGPRRKVCRVYSILGNERSRERMFHGTNSLGNEYSWYREHDTADTSRSHRVQTTGGGEARSFNDDCPHTSDFHSKQTTMGRGQRSGYRHSQQVILSPCFRVEPVGEWTLTNPCLVGRNTRMYTRNFVFRSFCNMSDNGRFRELIDEVNKVFCTRCLTERWTLWLL